MEPNDAMDCSVCQEEFDENQKCPRILPCFHSLCEGCILKLITRNDRKCPLCRRDFTVKSPEELSQNTIYLDLLKYVKKLEAKAKESDISATNYCSEFVKGKKRETEETKDKNIGNYKEAVNRLENTVQRNLELKRNILESQRGLKEETEDIIKELNYKCDMQVKYIDEENQKLTWQIKEAKINLKLYASSFILDETTTVGVVDSYLEESKVCDETAQSWLKKFKSRSSRQDKLHRGMKKNLRLTKERICRLYDILSSQASEENELKQVLSATTLQDDEGTEGKRSVNLQKLSLKTRYLISLGGVYAVHKNQEVSCAKISVCGDKILLHCLSEEQLPSDICTVQHSEAINLLNTSSWVIFLEFGTDKATYGKVFIRVCPYTKRAKNFKLMSTGERGKSYLNTEVIYIGNKGFPGEYIHFGASKEKKECKGRCLVPGAGKEEGGILKKPDVTGSVYGMFPEEQCAAQFGIRTKGCSGSLYTVFGKVESGLHILNEMVSKFPGIDDVKIIDCGVVLPI